MSNRNSVDSTGTLFFTKYSDPTKRNNIDKHSISNVTS